MEPSLDAEDRRIERSLAPAAPLAATAAGAPQDLDADFLQGLDREIFGDPASEARPGAAEHDDPSGERADAPSAAAPPSPVRARSGFGTIAAVLGLVVVGFGGAITFALTTRGGVRTDAEPVIVRADERPTRVMPPAAPQASAQTNESIIFERGSAPAARAPGERVVSREEQPVEMPRSDVRVVTPSTSPQSAEPPRRVTTTTIRVRPDGTLESEPTRPLAQAQAARAVDPTTTAAIAPAQPSQSSASALALPAAPVLAAAPAASSAASPPIARPAPATRTPAPVATAAPLPLSAPQRTAAVEPAARAAPVGSYVQLTSQRSEAAARTAFGDIARQHAAIIGSRRPDIRRVDLGERGTFYRARVGGFGSRDEAAQFCTRLRTAGGVCVVATN